MDRLKDLESEARAYARSLAWADDRERAAQDRVVASAAALREPYSEGALAEGFEYDDDGQVVAS